MNVVTPTRPAVAADVADHRPIYDWDEWDVHEYFDFREDILQAQLAAVSGRGAIALTLAVGEWICQRYSRLNADPAPLQFLEACWAEQMQPDLGSYMETDDDEWRGVVRGPLSIMMTIANDALYCLDEDEDTAVRAAWMTNLARHVLPRRDAFDAWLEAVVARLAAHHPRALADAQSLDGDLFGLGRPIARELFDTTEEFTAAEEPALIRRFLASVDPTNPFLAANAVFDDED
jgi:hypothetical protein